MNCPAGVPIKVRVPWYVVALRQDDKSILLWDGECTVRVEGRRDVQDGVIALENERARRFNERGSA